MGGDGRAGAGWLGGVGGAWGGSGRPGGAHGGGAGDGGAAGWLRTNSSTIAISSFVELAASPPDASGGSIGEGKFGGGGRSGGGAGGAGGLNEARQQPVQSQSSSLNVSSQVKESFNAAHDSSRMHRRSHGSSGSLPAAAGRLQSSRPTATTAETRRRIFRQFALRRHSD